VILRSTNIRAALRSRQRGFVLDPYRFSAGGGGGGDPHFANVELLLRGIGSNGSTTFTDESSNGYTVTPSGDAQISTAQGLGESSSMLFDGSGDYVTATVTGGLGGHADWTVEWFVRFISTGNYLFNSRTGGGAGDGMDIAWNAGCSTAGNAFLSGIGSGNFSTGVDYHVAVTREGTTYRNYLDGAKIGENVSTDFNFTGTDFKIGGSPHGNVGYLNGYMKCRVTVGIARYGTANFMPPTSFPTS
jgi:hypothetical protein